MISRTTTASFLEVLSTWVRGCPRPSRSSMSTPKPSDGFRPGCSAAAPLGDARPEEPIRPELVQQLVSATDALEHRLFSGRLDLERLGRTERFVARWVGATNGDYREWDEIAEWVRKIAACLDPSAGETERPTI